MYAFIELFAPHLKRTVVEKAIAESATERNKNQAVGRQTLPGRRENLERVQRIA
jgi:hypothetical protein